MEFIERERKAGSIRKTLMSFLHLIAALFLVSLSIMVSYESMKIKTTHWYRSFVT